ncbi:MAG: DinB family protein [Bacteroidota bacterium]
MDKEQIIKDINENTEVLIDQLQRVPEDIFNSHPDTDTWSVGDVVEHLLKIEKGAVNILTGDSQHTDRDYKEKVEIITTAFLNFERKLKSGGPVNPTNNTKVKDEVIEKFAQYRAGLVGMLSDVDLTLEYTGFSHRLTGYMTGYEWIYFLIHHTTRHVHQIKEIQGTLKH